MRKKRKIMLFVFGCFVLLLMGSSFAFWSGKIEHTNVLQADKINAKITETFDSDAAEPSGTVQKEVAFKNNSSNASFLRVSYGETWETTENGKTFLLNNQVNGVDVAEKKWLNGFAENSDLWTKDDDGWYYYNRVLKPGAETEKILESVTFPDHSGDYEEYKGADYQLYFRMELLQVSDSQSTLNSAEVNQKASQTVFGKTATVNGTTVSWQ